jgi:hypothetical protein
LGSDNPYLGSNKPYTASVRPEDIIFQGNEQNYISDPNINRDYLNIDKNDVVKQNLIGG